MEEAIDGLSVEDILENGLYRYRAAKAVLADVLDGLSALHAAGFVHRDIKPSNILITKDNVAKLIDYDAARFVHTTADTVRLGTPGYAAPEQYVGSSGIAADIYAIGVLLNIMLTGVHPSEKLPDEKNARNLVIRATQINPGDRFASAEAFRKAL